MPNHIVSGNVDTMMRAADNAAIRSAIGVGTTDAPTFYGVGLTNGYLGGNGQSNGCDVFTNSSNFRIGRDASLSWNGGANQGLVGADTSLFRDGAPGILAQRNGVNAQAFRVYDTYDTAGTNYERGTFGFPVGTNTLRIGTEQAGTGAAQPIEFVTGGVVRMSIAAGGEVTFQNALVFGSNGRFRFLSNGVAFLTNAAETDFGRLCLGGNTSAFPAIKRNGTGIDIRLADDSGPAPLTASNIVTSGYFSTSGYCIVGSNNGYFWPSKGGIYAPSDGVMRLSNDSVSGFTRLELGTANLGISRGANSPEGVVTALVGSLYIRTDGGASTTLYVKESGTGNTGWVAK